MLAPEEKWLPVVDWEGFYEVSDQGRVRSIGRLIVTVDGRPHGYRPGRMIASHINNRGYPQVKLRNLGRTVTAPVHRLVLEAFVGPRAAGYVARHMNGDRSDPRLENVVYGTPSENNYDTVAHGNHRGANKTHCKWGHPLSGPNLRWGKTGRGQGIGRICRQCARDRRRRHESAKAKAAA